jgi:type II secretory pathway component PulF
MSDSRFKEQAPLPTHDRSCAGMLYADSVPERALLQVLAMADRHNQPAPTLLAVLAREFPGDYGRGLMQLSATLSNGYSVVDALQQTPGIMDRSLVMALRLADQSRALPEMYESLLAGSGREETQSDSEWNNPLSELTQVGFGFLFAILMITFLMLFIIPTFEQMFAEFGLLLPAPMLWLIAFCRWFASYWFVLAAIGLVGAIVLSAGRFASLGVFLTRRFNPLARSEGLVSPSASLISLLAVAARLGQPIATGVHTLARYSQRPAARRRFGRVHERIEQGEEPWHSLAAEKLISRRDAQALITTDSGRAQAWLLDRSAAARQSRWLVRGRLATSTVTFLCTLALAFIVAWTAISVFMVLYSLVSSLS